MADDDLDTLTTAALNALASSPGGMTVPDLVTHIETRHGPTDEAAQDARHPATQDFLSKLQDLVRAGGQGSLIDRGFAIADATGGIIRITDAGRAYVGR